MEGSKKNEIVIKKANDHWAFLEHIEAPMWADLTLEANSLGEDRSDGGWFNTTHPFHQWSARELKSKFSHPGDEIVTSRVDLQGLTSPKLPSSVSRSRGKHYNSKKWEGTNLNILLDKQQGLSGRCLQPGSRFDQEVKPKLKSNAGRPKGLLSTKLGLTYECTARRKTKSIASCSSNLVGFSSFVDDKTGKRTTRSTITSENPLQQQKHKEVTSQPCNIKSRSSSLMSVSLENRCVAKKASSFQRQQKCVGVSSHPLDEKSKSSSVSSVSVSLRKSYVTASRVEVGVDSMQSRGRKSSTGKSSVGSSSNPGYGAMFVPKQRREKITDEKDVKKMDHADKKGPNPGSGSSSVSSDSLRKSYVTEKASKVELGVDSMRSRGRKSSSGKSSVGSCSNSGYEVKVATKQQGEKITDEKDMMNHAEKNRCNPGNKSKTCAILIERAKFGNRKEGNIDYAKPAYHRTAKSLVQCQSISSRAKLPAKVNKENSCTGTKERIGTRKVNSMTGKGKENAVRNATVNQKCNDRGVRSGGMLKNQRTTGHNRQQNDDMAGSAALKILGKVKDQHEAKNPTNIDRRIYLR